MQRPGGYNCSSCATQKRPLNAQVPMRKNTYYSYVPVWALGNSNLSARLLRFQPIRRSSVDSAVEFMDSSLGSNFRSLMTGLQNWKTSPDVSMRIEACVDRTKVPICLSSTPRTIIRYPRPVIRHQPFQDRSCRGETGRTGFG